MQQTKNDMLGKANGIAQDFAAQVQNGEQKIEKMSAEAGQKVGVIVADIGKSTTQYVQTSREYVQENPIKGIAIAAAAGLVAGSLLTLALRKKQ